MVRRLLTPRWLLLHALAVLAVLTCFRLAWWQWDRSVSPTGSLQNLGYALQWPLFGLFVPFIYWRMIKLERDRKQETQPKQDMAEPIPSAAPTATRRSPTEWRDQGKQVTAAQDAVFAEYNNYLASLNADVASPEVHTPELSIPK